MCCIIKVQSAPGTSSFVNLWALEGQFLSTRDMVCCKDEIVAFLLAQFELFPSPKNLSFKKVFNKTWFITAEMALLRVNFVCQPMVALV